MSMTGVVHGAVAFALLSLAFVRNAAAATNCGSPGPNQAIVWEHYDYTGNCDVLEVGSYPYSAVNAMSVGNDSISSVSVGSNVKVTLYAADLPGTGPDDWLPLTTTRSVYWDFNDTTSSIRVEPRTGCTTSPEANQCVVWADNGYSGYCDVVDLDYPVSYEKILGLSVGNDTISSVICGSGSAALMWDADLNSDSSFFTGEAPFVGSLPTFNDRVSSLIVQSRPVVGCWPGYNTCGGDAFFCEDKTVGCVFLSYTASDGACVVRPTSCPLILTPSCGCDGKSYANDCERQAAGTSKWYDGHCSDSTCPVTAPQSGSSCTGNIRCVYPITTGPDAGCVQGLSCAGGVWSAPTVNCDL